MKTDYSPEKEQIVFGNDSAVIRKYISGISGGRTLDVSGFSKDNIKAGHVIIKKSNGDYAPMPILPAQEAKPAVGDVPALPERYGTLPSGASYVGVLYRSISVKKPEAAIMNNGVVNPTLTPYDMSEIMTAFKAACQHITFEQDEEA